MTDTGIECGHQITIGDKTIGWALRSGIVQTGLRETVWIETVEHYDLVTAYASLPTKQQDTIPRTTIVMLREDFDREVGIQ